jgi:1,4-alpha-glucan branching enzyme
VTEPSKEALLALAEGRYALPFDVLGLHPDAAGDGWVVRAWAPTAGSVEIVRNGATFGTKRRSEADVFEAHFPGEEGPFVYRLRVDGVVREDPYRFLPVHTDEELERVRRPDGRVHELLGAHAVEREGVPGTAFAVWAPAASAVAVVGSFNSWNEIAHPMRARGTTGVWEIFVPGVAPGALYKYRIVGPHAPKPFLKADPCGRAMQLRPETASIVADTTRHTWSDDAWRERRAELHERSAPMSIYEVHLGSWRRHRDAKPRDGVPGWLDFREIADELVPYVADLGFTHVELLPVTEHPHDGSWGYQTVGYFAPTARHGAPDDLRYLVDRAHAAGIGVILDWVPAHFPSDPHGLAHFDGTQLYEHADPRKGVHPDWGTYIFNYGRPEVVSFLVSSALYWIEEFHVDGLRLDAVASMLYLDYSRKEGQWVPNPQGGRENLEAIDFLRTLNEVVDREHPDVVVTAEESTAWPGVTHPSSEGGLGFDLKWNMGWMHDTLEVMQTDPLFRKGSYEKLTFSITYAFAERFLLPFSHDEVVHLKRSMLGKMPGEALDRFANLRLLYGYMWTHPGKKLLFMGSEIGVWNEWDADGELDWGLLDEPMHAGLQAWLRALNTVYAREPALHDWDWSDHGFEWIDCHDRDRTTLAYLRWSRDWRDFVVVACNFTPVAWRAYRLAVPFTGHYDVLLDSGATEFGGAGQLEAESFEAAKGEHLGRPYHIELTLPALTALVLKKKPEVG